MKKYVSIICVSIILFCFGNCYAKAENINDVPIQVLTDLGVITGNSDEDLMLDKKVNRAEFASMIYRLKYDDPPQLPPSSVFTDVDLHHWASGYIHVMYFDGIISGYADGTFKPSKGVTVNEAYAMALRMAGYSYYMSSQSGIYPENIENTARMTGLSDGVALSGESELSRRDVAEILYNLLDINIMLTSYTIDETPKHYQGGIFYEEIMGLYRGEGIIDGVEGITLEDSNIDEKYITIYGTKMYNDIGITEEDLGLRGTYYYDEDDAGDKYIKVFVPKKNTILEITSEQSPSYANNTYTYYDGKRRKTVKVSPQKDIIYNGAVLLDVGKMLPNYGKISLVDNNGDKEYDVIKIEDYEFIYYEYLNEAEEILYYLTNNGRKGINIKDYDRIKIYNEVGEEINFSAISEKTLVMVQKSKKTLKLTACTKTILGEIVKYYKGEANESDSVVFEGDETEYCIATGFVNMAGNLSIGLSVETHLDKFGNIALITPTDNEGKWLIGYLLKLRVNSDDESVYIKILTQNGNIEEYNLHEKVRLDGENTLRENVIIPYGTVFRFSLNGEGNVRKIDLPFNKSFYESKLNIGEKNEEDNSLMLRTDAKLSYTQAQKSWRRVTVEDDNDAALLGRPFVNEETIIFSVPNESQFTGDESDYTVMNVDGIRNHMISRISSYNTKVDSLTSEVLVIRDGAGELDNSARPILVTKIENVLNEDDEVVYKLTGYYKGAESVFVFKDIDDATIDGRLVEKYDLLQIVEKDGIITACKLLYSNDGTKGELVTTGWYGSSYGLTAEIRYIKGKAIYCEDKKMLFDPDAAIGYDDAINLEGFRVYIVDYDMHGIDVVREGTWREIISQSDNSTKYDTLILGTEWGGPLEVYVIRNQSYLVK